MVSLKVYIPTRGRVGLNRQVTLREFIQYSSHEPILVCPPSEVVDHKRYWSRVLACPAKGIGATRQWIVDHSSHEIVVMADDDMQFAYRPDPTRIKLERCTDLDTLLALIKKCVEDGFIHGGVSARQGNNRVASPFRDCTRAINFHYLHLPRLFATGARLIKGFSPEGIQLCMEDFFLTLSLLTAGYPNRVIYSHCWNQNESGARGGCSLYRTKQVQQMWCEELKKSFPDFVRIVRKETKSSWSGFKERTDVVVYWQKAWLSSQCTSGR